MRDQRRSRVIGWVVGAVVGGVLGAVVALNLMIYLGDSSGYEASLTDVFAHNPLAGILVITVLVAGPVLGVVVANRSGRGIARNPSNSTPRSGEPPKI